MEKWKVVVYMKIGFPHLTAFCLFEGFHSLASERNHTLKNFYDVLTPDQITDLTGFRNATRYRGKVETRNNWKSVINEFLDLASFIVSTILIFTFIELIKLACILKW